MTIFYISKIVFLLLQGYVKQGKKNFVVVPIAFVNEHIETLHELDIEYCHELAEEVRLINYAFRCFIFIHINNKKTEGK